MNGWTGRRGSARRGARSVGFRPIAAVLVLLGSLAFYAYQQWSIRSQAPVVGAAWVADGDSIEISGRRIRLEGIDAPELDQTCADSLGRSWACGKTAADELRAHIRNRALTCKPAGVDQYERVLAICSLPDGSDVNAWMVRQGWAFAFGRAGAYRSEQDEARMGKRGVWAGRVEHPWEWRRRHHE